MASINDEARSRLLSAMSVLMRRRAETTDAAEKEVITRTLMQLNNDVDQLEEAELLDSAAAVGNASDALERAIGAAKVRPFDDYLNAIAKSLAELEQIGGEMHRRESLPNADFAGDVMPAAPAAPARSRGRATRAAAAAATIPSVSTSLIFADLAAECDSLYAACTINPDRVANVDFFVSRVLKFKPVYQSVAADLNGVPWQFVGITHGMESGFDFTRHLHNGDPLTGRTVQVPAGRPPSGQPPFTWRASALDALMLKGLHQIARWPRARVLYELERYNGFGYRRLAMPTPYLWSFTNLYAKGKFVRDHEFDPEAVSKQCGAAAVMKGLDAKGEGVAA